MILEIHVADYLKQHNISYAEIRSLLDFVW